MVTATIVYESMFGATRRVAEAIARGMTAASGGEATVIVRRAGDVSPEEVTDADVLLVGAPTHVHSLSRPETRLEAERWSQDIEQDLPLEPGALGPGVREFIRGLPPTDAPFVAFGTRADSPEIFTGSSAKAIRKRLKKRGLKALLPPMSFVVTKESRLVEGEEQKAVEFGRSVVEAARQATPAAAS
jgi:hypothetical protein